jgi:hypothetical protein
MTWAHCTGTVQYMLSNLLLYIYFFFLYILYKARGPTIRGIQLLSVQCYTDIQSKMLTDWINSLKTLPIRRIWATHSAPDIYVILLLSPGLRDLAPKGRHFLRIRSKWIQNLAIRNFAKLLLYFETLLYYFAKFCPNFADEFCEISQKIAPNFVGTCKFSGLDPGPVPYQIGQHKKCTWDSRVIKQV